MRGLSHPNALRLLEVMATRSKICLVTFREEAEVRATARGAGSHGHGAGTARARRGGGLQCWRRGTRAGAGEGRTGGRRGERGTARGLRGGQGAGDGAGHGLQRGARWPRVRRGRSAGGVVVGCTGSTGPKWPHLLHIVATLRYCHARGVAHRDVKPQNLLLARDGALKLSDFGLAALAEQRGATGAYARRAGPWPTRYCLLMALRLSLELVSLLMLRVRRGARRSMVVRVILFVLLAGQLPFDDANISLMSGRIHRRDYAFPPWVSPFCNHLISLYARCRLPVAARKIEDRKILLTAASKYSVSLKGLFGCTFSGFASDSSQAKAGSTMDSSSSTKFSLRLI
uniref:Protein kinase domain-containing protein n=1 Tax=Ananas comosus var. bracteatus TaxID=296719 RepID=A0A6V7NJU7_ANACO|nr:unnamed protein product [Ananas comosus var. bracteatus]